ncbi:MAG: hypothetical protein GF418_02690 [Chitinivibrionales bacterium]|nr:hypothetical protein [Chitinivibrionales bacterium]MBD3394509.1 hypothetical protein [Chitinivibrionales bacterium]
MSKTVLAAALVCAFLTGPAFAASIPLSGEQDGLYERGNYVVTGDVEVKAGRAMRISPGSFLRFRPGTGMVVRGTLECAGDPVLPVVFTSTADTGAGARNKALPFDWAGIEIRDSGALRCEHARISFSTFGIRADSSSLVELHNVIFLRNGSADLQIGPSVVVVEEGAACDYSSRTEGYAGSGTARRRGGRRGRERGPRLKARVGLGVTCGLVAALGAGLAIYEHMRAGEYEEKYETGMGSNVAEYKRLYRQSIAGRNISIAAAAAGAVGLSVIIILR